MAAPPNPKTRRRQPKGVPVGGEFAANEHDEATAELMRYSPRIEASLPSKFGLSHKKLISEANKSAAIYARRMNMPYDQVPDMASTTIESLWASHGSKGKPIDGALVNYAARAVVSRALGASLGQRSGDDRSAAKTLREAQEATESELGRPMTDRERDELADDIRSTWHDQGRKPAVGYQNAPELVDLDEIDEDDVDPALIDPYSPEVHVSSDSPSAESALDRPNDAGRLKAKTKSELRAQAWQIISSDSGAPPVAAKLSKAQQKILASSVKSAGGVSSAIGRFDRGEEDSSTEALFMPFRKTVTSGDRTGFRRLSGGEKEEIVDVLRRNPSMADALWTSALASAR